MPDLTPADLDRLERRAREYDMSDDDMADVVPIIAALREAWKFKAFVHSYLDQRGVPHGELDLLLAERATLRERDAEIERLRHLVDALTARLAVIIAREALERKEHK